MAPSSKLLLLILLVFLAACTRSLGSGPTTMALSARLKQLDESTCWDSLFQLQSCTGEIIQFFYNGDANLGPTCCRSLHIIQHNCWPAVLASLGFTPQETALLQAYCHAKEDDSSPPPHSP